MSNRPPSKLQQSSVLGPLIELHKHADPWLVVWAAADLSFTAVNSCFQTQREVLDCVRESMSHEHWVSGADILIGFAAKTKNYKLFRLLLSYGVPFDEEKYLKMYIQ
eukprot:TRINITY_DN4139_c0_g1_i2.p1 TRINITY_DN4139_c0_g1~~TRINITY_DN4139_c0_g1_i2.p1  ORF type:complete len:107 (-),score=5.38 TRINITY_DN4139_c0_g1_i2:135-455(-)